MPLRGLQPGPTNEFQRSNTLGGGMAQGMAQGMTQGMAQGMAPCPSQCHGTCISAPVVALSARSQPRADSSLWRRNEASRTALPRAAIRNGKRRCPSSHFAKRVTRLSVARLSAPLPAPGPGQGVQIHTSPCLVRTGASSATSESMGKLQRRARYALSC